MQDARTPSCVVFCNTQKPRLLPFRQAAISGVMLLPMHPYGAALSCVKDLCASLTAHNVITASWRDTKTCRHNSHPDKHAGSASRCSLSCQVQSHAQAMQATQVAYGMHACKLAGVPWFSVQPSCNKHATIASKHAALRSLRHHARVCSAGSLCACKHHAENFMQQTCTKLADFHVVSYQSRPGQHIAAITQCRRAG